MIPEEDPVEVEATLRTVLQSSAKRADEHIELEDLRRATKVAARAQADLLVDVGVMIDGARLPPSSKFMNSWR